MQNREIEPGSVYLIFRGPRSKLSGFTWPCCLGHWASVVVYNALLFSIVEVVDRLIVWACGVSMKGLFPFWWGNMVDAHGHLGSVLVSFYLGGPFADMAETVSTSALAVRRILDEVELTRRS